MDLHTHPRVYSCSDTITTVQMSCTLLTQLLKLSMRHLWKSFWQPVLCDIQLLKCQPWSHIHSMFTRTKHPRFVISVARCSSVWLDKDSSVMDVVKIITNAAWLRSQTIAVAPMTHHRHRDVRQLYNRLVVRLAAQPIPWYPMMLAKTIPGHLWTSQTNGTIAPRRIAVVEVVPQQS